MFVYQDNKIIDIDTGKTVIDILKEITKKSFRELTEKEKLARIFFIIFYEDESLKLFEKYLGILINFYDIKDKPEKISEAANIILSIQNSSKDLIDFAFFDTIIYEDKEILSKLTEEQKRKVFK